MTETRYGDDGDRVLKAFHSPEDAANYGMALAASAQRKGKGDDWSYKVQPVKHGGGDQLHVVAAQGDGHGEANSGEDISVLRAHPTRASAEKHQIKESKEAWADTGPDEPHPGVEKANAHFRNERETGGFTAHSLPIHAPRGSRG